MLCLPVPWLCPACCAAVLLLPQNVVRMVRQIHKDRHNLRRGLRGTTNILKVRPSLPCACCPQACFACMLAPSSLACPSCCVPTWILPLMLPSPASPQKLDLFIGGVLHVVFVLFYLLVFGVSAHLRPCLLVAPAAAGRPPAASGDPYLMAVPAFSALLLQVAFNQGSFEAFSARECPSSACAGSCRCHPAHPPYSSR